MFFYYWLKPILAYDAPEAAPLLTEAPSSIPTGDVGAAFAKMLLTFLALILLLCASYWVVRRLIRHRLERGVGTASIHVLEKRMISPKTMLYLVEVEGKKVLIAESHLEIKRIEGFNSEIIS